MKTLHYRFKFIIFVGHPRCMKTISRIGNFTFLTLLCLSFQWACSQSIQNDVVASSGGTSILENLQLSWTLGESFTETYQHDNMLISQGFHQPLLIVMDIPNHELPALNVEFFPNPTRDILHVELPGTATEENYLLILLDINGKTILSENICNDNKYELDFSHLNQGIYLLTLERKSGAGRFSWKIIKADN